MNGYENGAISSAPYLTTLGFNYKLEACATLGWNVTKRYTLNEGECYG